MEKRREKFSGDLTKPHLRKFFKTIPMKDENGNVIPDNPPLQHGGPWAPKQRGFDIGKNKSKT